MAEENNSAENQFVKVLTDALEENNRKFMDFLVPYFEKLEVRLRNDFEF